METDIGRELSQESGTRFYYAVNYPIRAIFSSWRDCKPVVEKVLNAKYKKFTNLRIAKNFMMGMDTSDCNGSEGQAGDPVTQPKGDFQQINSINNLSSSSSSGKRKRQDSVEFQRGRIDDEELIDLTQAIEDDEESVESPRIDNVKRASLFFDGACRGNPGPGSCGAVLYDDEAGGIEIWRHYRFLGPNYTCNMAEYHGLIVGLEAAILRNVKTLRVYGDSQLIVNQIKRTNRVKAYNLLPLFDEAQRLISMGSFESFSIEAIPREQNTVADRLANQAFDEHRSQNS